MHSLTSKFIQVWCLYFSAHKPIAITSLLIWGDEYKIWSLHKNLSLSDLIEVIEKWCSCADKIPESVFLHMLQDLKVSPIIKVICLRPKNSHSKKNMIKIRLVETFVYRYPLETPVQTSLAQWLTDQWSSWSWPIKIIWLVLGKYGVITQLAGPSTERIWSNMY